MARKTLDELYDLAAKVLMNSKTSESNADSVANALISAEADGMASHGMSRLPSYADQAISGKVDGQARPVLEQTAAATLRVDARGGFAYPAIELGLERALRLAPETGIVGVAITHSHHSGVAGLAVEGVAKHGFVAMSFGNSPAGMAPWGGNRPIYGTNPIAFACPRPASDGDGWGAPIVVDLAMSKVARGKINLAAQKGEQIPEGWAVDRDGNPTTDAKAAMEGWLLPMGDARGASLVLMVEIMAATLTGSNHGFEASSFFTADGPPPHIGQSYIVIDPKAFAGSAEVFAERMATLMEAYTSQPGTRLPGVRRQELRAKAETDGVEVPDNLLEQLEKRAVGPAA